MVLMKRKEMEKVSSLVKSPIQYSMQKTLLQYAMDKIYFVVLQKRTEASSSSSLRTRYVHESQVSLPNPAETERSLARSSSSIDARTEGQISLLNQISAPPGSLSEKTISILSPQVACDLRRGPCQASREPCRPLSCMGILPSSQRLPSQI